MSLIDLASLVLAPTATKEGKVYSAIPDTGDGDMTFSRGSAATRVNSAGLIEKERANLLLQSNTFDVSANWALTNAPALTSGQSGYDGTNDAWKLEATTTGSSRSIHQINYTSGVQVFSVYVKAGTTDWIRLNLSGIGNRYFDIGNGVVGGSGNIDGFITDVGGGWYRCSVLGNGSSTAPYIFLASDNGNLTVNAGDNILIQDAMLNEGLVAFPYIETTTAAVYEGITDDVPRVDYSGGGCPALKLEPQRTNLITQSEYFGAWTNDTNTSLTANAIQSPSGFVDAYKMSAGTSTARQAIKLLLTPSGDVVQSVFAKKGEYSVVQITDGRNPNLYANFDLENGVLGNYEDCTPSIEEFNDGWYRCVIVYNSTLDIVNTRISIAESPTQARLVNFAGNGSDGIYIWGAMVEAGSYVSSYINSYGTSTTRVADSCSKTGISELIGQTEGTMFLNLLAIESEGSEFYQASFSDGSNNEAAIFGFTNTSGQLRFRLENGGVAQCQIYANSIDTSTYVKAAIAYKENDFAFYVNGVQAGTDTSGSVPSSLTQFHFANGANTSTQMYGNIKEVVFFPTRLTNDELAELTKL